MDIRDEVRDIFWSYHVRDKTTKDLFYSIPRVVLLDLISKIECILDRGVVGSNCCSECGHIHNDADDEYRYFSLMLDRARQALAGMWIKKCRHGMILSL